MSRNSTTARWASWTRLVCVWHDHAVAHGRRARGLELRNALDLDQAHAARADGLAQLGLVAEHRDLDVAVLGGVDEHRLRGRLDVTPVEREGDPLELRPRHTVTVRGG
jgi:hypothetical protein